MTQETPLILVVDDEPANVALLERLLNRHYHVGTALDGQSALDLLEQAPFDLVLLDIMMPGTNGLQVLHAIRENPQMADLPVILVSALSTTKDVTRGLELGANDYITKPIDIDIMLARVRTQLRLKRLEDERKNTIEQLAAAHEMQERLLQIASHDLKGPLMNIGMAAKLIRPYSEDIPDGPDLLEALDMSLDTMQTVITDFLDTAVLQAGGLNFEPAYLDLNQVISNLTKQFIAHAARKQIMIDVDYAGGTIVADKARFEQALGNLISNAIKYSPPKTTVHIWTEPAESMIRICVADQGPGIPANERERLFTQFGKLSPRPTAGENSTGLGLWIVKHLVTEQNGEVGVHNPPEGGSIFWIEMPEAEMMSVAS